MISAPRQLNTARTPGNSATVLAALLSALLLLSPATARAVAHILAENGVSIPVHVVRVLDTVTVDALRDVRRPQEEEGTETALTAAPDTHPAPTHEPAPVVLLPLPQTMVVAPARELTPRPVCIKGEQVLPLSVARSLGPPRAPPAV